MNRQSRRADLRDVCPCVFSLQCVCCVPVYPHVCISPPVPPSPSFPPSHARSQSCTHTFEVEVECALLDARLELVDS
eukprot:1794467-Rhodomonas_salina.1